jgi:hypothetical protein
MTTNSTTLTQSAHRVSSGHSTSAAAIAGAAAMPTTTSPQMSSCVDWMRESVEGHHHQIAEDQHQWSRRRPEPEHQEPEPCQSSENHEPGQEKLDQAVHVVWRGAAVAVVFLLDGRPQLQKENHRPDQTNGGQDGDPIPPLATPRTGLRLFGAHQAEAII